MKQLTSMLTMLLLFTYVNAQVGSLDPSFNNPDGFVINPQSPTGDDYGNSIAVQSDGKVLVAVVVPEQYFKIIRYKLNGTLDSSFGTDGVVTVREGTSSTAQSHAVALQSDGKIIVGGYTWSADNNDFALARLKTDGVVDSTFGTNGWVYTNMKGITTSVGDDQIRKLVVLPDNSIIAAGYSHNTQDKDFAIAKYDVNGALVTSFGTNGKIVLDIDNEDYVTGLAVTSTGKIVVVGNTGFSTDTDITVAQYTSAGIFDSGFNGGNPLTLGGGSAGNYEGYGLAVQSDDKIVVTGLMPAASSSKNIYVARILPDGTFDPLFNGGAELSINYASGVSNEEGRSVIVQSDGKIIIAGYTDAVSSPSRYDLLLVRLNANGTFDTNFDTDGKAVTGISTTSTSDFSMAAALYGTRIYLTGSTDYSGTSTMDFFLAALLNDFSTLPIVLSDFYAQKLTSAVNLKWQTSSEENVKRFIIERSSDGKTYKSIGQVTAIGNSSIKQSYNYVDNSPLMPATNFYRLLMQDVDGNTRYSKIVTVKYTGELSLDMQLSPNPTSNLLQVQLPDGFKGTVSLLVYDLNGRMVKRQNLASDGNALSTSIDVSGLQNGIYILKAQSGATSLTSRFMKK